MLNSLSANPKKSSNTLKKLTFLNIIGSTDRKILTRSYSQVTETLLYGDSNSNNITNTLILTATIDFLIVTKRFDAHVLKLNIYIYIYIYIFNPSI